MNNLYVFTKPLLLISILLTVARESQCQNYRAFTDTCLLNKVYTLVDSNTKDTSNICYLGVININESSYQVVTNKKTIVMAQSNRGQNLLVLLNATEELAYIVNLREELPTGVLDAALIFHIEGKVFSKRDFTELPHVFCLPERKGCFERE